MSGQSHSNNKRKETEDGSDDEPLDITLCGPRWSKNYGKKKRANNNGPRSGAKKKPSEPKPGWRKRTGEPRPGFKIGSTTYWVGDGAEWVYYKDDDGKVRKYWNGWTSEDRLGHMISIHDLEPAGKGVKMSAVDEASAKEEQIRFAQMNEFKARLDANPLKKQKYPWRARRRRMPGRPSCLPQGKKDAQMMSADDEPPAKDVQMNDARMNDAQMNEVWKQRTDQLNEERKEKSVELDQAWKEKSSSIELDAPWWETKELKPDRPNAPLKRPRNKRRRLNPTKAERPTPTKAESPPQAHFSFKR